MVIERYLIGTAELKCKGTLSTGNCDDKQTHEVIMDAGNGSAWIPEPEVRTVKPTKLSGEHVSRRLPALAMICTTTSLQKPQTNFLLPIAILVHIDAD